MVNSMNQTKYPITIYGRMMNLMNQTKLSIYIDFVLIFVSTYL